jgi:ATP-dependent Clp protease ATP-binding subunit ClpA
MFERFTDRARRVIALAQEESRALNHNYIGTEHMLLGLIRERDGLAARALESLRISLKGMRQEVKEIVGEGEATPPGHVPFTPRAKKVLENALRESLGLGQNYVGTEHLLLGMLRESEGVGCQALVRSGFSLQQIRDATLGVIVHQPKGGQTIPIAQEPTKAKVLESVIGRRCPGCARLLEDTARYHALEVPSDAGEGSSISVHVVSCIGCGHVLGLVSTT